VGVALIHWGRFWLHGDPSTGSKITVPAPSTDGNNVPWLWDDIAANAPGLAAIGFTAIQLPPASKAQGGAGVGCDGYGGMDWYDLGSKNQQGSIPTRYGYDYGLRRAVARAHAVGMDVYVDCVPHQLAGGNAGAYTYRFPSSTGNTNGRGAMNKGNFRGPQPVDPVPVPADDFAFGDEIVYVNSDPPGSSLSKLLDWGHWLFTTTDADGLRCDDTKGTNAGIVRQFLTIPAMAGKFKYSEYFDGNPANLNHWVTASIYAQGVQGASNVEDFTLHWAMQGMCHGGRPYPMNGAGYVQWDASRAVTFVDNPDTDLSAGQPIIFNKLWAYVFILTMEGYPFVYGKDYFPSSKWPGAYGLKPWIDNLVWIHEVLASGDTSNRCTDSTVIVYERTGGPGLLVGVSTDPLYPQTRTVQTAMGGGVHLHDYSGHGEDVWTNNDGTVTITIPSNHYGAGNSYVCYSRDGFQGRPIPINGRQTVQTFYGASDLDISPLKNATTPVGKVWCAKGSTIALRWTMDATGWSNEASASLVVEQGSLSFGHLSYDTQGAHAQTLEAVVPATGWVDWTVTGAGLVGPVNFTTTATYHADAHPLPAGTP
jgi:alpha-amylase